MNLYLKTTMGANFEFHDVIEEELQEILQQIETNIAVNFDGLTIPISQIHFLAEEQLILKQMKYEQEALDKPLETLKKAYEKQKSGACTACVDDAIKSIRQKRKDDITEAERLLASLKSIDAACKH